jgi:hypothetical protein
MKRLASALCLLTGLALASCSDSGDDAPVAAADAAVSPKDGASTDTGGVDAGIADTASSADSALVDAASTGDPERACKGLMKSNPTTRGKLATAVTVGKCMAPSDLDSICDNDIVDITSNCGGLAFLAQKFKSDAGANFMLDEAALRTATLMCVGERLGKTVVTDGCLSCYGEAVTCTLAHCANVCLPDPTNPACRPCQISSGCGVALDACTGLPPAPMADGGAGDGGSVDAAPADAAPADAGASD